MVEILNKNIHSQLGRYIIDRPKAQGNNPDRKTASILCELHNTILNELQKNILSQRGETRRNAAFQSGEEDLKPWASS